MTVRRVLTVTAAAGACLLGSALPAQAAAPGPWKSTAYRGTAAGAPAASTATPVAGPVAPAASSTPAAPAAPAATAVDAGVAMATQIAVLVNNERAAAGLAPLKVSGCAQTF